MRTHICASNLHNPNKSFLLFFPDRCKNPDYQIYDHDRRVCVSKVGGPCIIASHSDSADSSFRNGTHNSKFNPDSFPIIKCIPYAECVPLTINTRVFMTPLINGKGVPGVCECGETFLPTKKGICSLPRGADCDTSSKDKKDQCASPLQCVSGRCDCPNEVDVYEDETKKCAKPVQSLCWKDSSCVKNAMCKLRNKHLPGRCKCLSKFKTTSLSTCVWFSVYIFQFYYTHLTKKLVLNIYINYILLVIWIYYIMYNKLINNV